MVGKNHLIQNLFDNKILASLCNLLNIILKVKKNDFLSTEWLEVQQLFTLMTMQLTRSWGSLLLPGITREKLLHVTNPEKDQNSKYKVRFLLNVYHIHTIVESKYRKLNPCKLRTTYSVFSPLEQCLPK